MKKDKIDQDFQNFNSDLEHATEREIMNVRDEITALKEKVAKISVSLEQLSPMRRKEVSEEKS
jgi:polyhydroxyalkanoate synthesis regulator phasin